MKKDKVVFKCHTPYTLFTAAIIGNLYFDKSVKLLIATKYLTSRFKNRMIQSGLFDEIYCFDESVKDISKTEKQVDDFIDKNCDIKYFFACVLDDPYTVMMIEKLHNKSKIELFPEGASVNQLVEVLEIVHNKVYGREKYNNDFFDEYYMDYKKVDKLWLYDLKMYHSRIKLELKEIDKEAIWNNNNQIIDKLNYLFDYVVSDEITSNYIYLETGMVEENRVLHIKQKEVEGLLFQLLYNNMIVVKPHPGQNMNYIKSEFNYKNAIIYSKLDIPFELIFINNLKNNEDLTIITPYFCTAINSVVSFVSEDKRKKIHILILYKMLENYYDEYISSAKLWVEQDIERLKREYNGLDLYTPKSVNELKVYFKREVNYTNKTNDIAYDYFDKIGNLLETSLLYDGKVTYSSYFDYLGKSVIEFNVSDYVSDENVYTWLPSVNDIFKYIDNLKIYIVNKNIKHRVHFTINGKEISECVIEKRQSLVIRLNSNEYGEKIIIECNFSMRNKIMSMVRMNNNLDWRCEFWKKIATYDSTKMLKYLKDKEISKVWIFGDGDVGKILYEKLKEYVDNISFVVSKNVEKDNYYSINNIDKIVEYPDLIVITVMQNYWKIKFDFPTELHDKIISVNDFIVDI